MWPLISGLYFCPDGDGAGGAPPENQGAGSQQGAADAAKPGGGLKIPAGMASAMQKAGLDPEKVTAEEALQFADKGIKTFLEERDKEREKRAAADDRARQAKDKISSLTIEQVLGDTEVPEATRQKLQGVLKESQRLTSVEEILHMAVETGMLPEAAGNAILRGDREMAQDVFSLIKQIMERQGVETKIAASGVGGGIAPPPSDGKDIKPPSLLRRFLTGEDSPAKEFVDVFTGKGKGAK